MQGLSLIELLLCLLLLSMIFVFGLPFSYTLLEDNQRLLRTDEIVFAVNYARDIAILQGVPLVLAPITTDSTAEKADWSKGMILFVDNPKHQYNNKRDILLYKWQWPENELRIIWKGFYSEDYLRFSNVLKNASLSGHFDIFRPGASKHSRLIINRIGRVTKRIIS